jgi:hypothetical protein
MPEGDNHVSSTQSAANAERIDRRAAGRRRDASCYRRLRCLAEHSERQRNKTLGKELGALAKTAEAGSTLKTELDKMQAAIAKRDAELDFYKSAPDDVVNLRLAWLAATDLQLIDEKDNSVDWKALRTAQPLLFRKTASTNAGAGATQNGQGSVDMNALIRGSAGRR